MQRISIDDEFLRSPEVLEKLGINRAKLRKLIRSGELKAIDIRTPGGSYPVWIFPKQSLEDFINRRAEQAAEPTTRRRRGRRLREPIANPRYS